MAAPAQQAELCPPLPAVKCSAVASSFSCIQPAALQDGSLSVWRRQPSGLSYTLLCLHKLVPPASRISNNATVSLLCIAACAWVRCNTDPRRSTVLPPMQHTVSEFGVVTANSPRAALDNVSHPFGRAPCSEGPEGPPQSRLQTPAAAGADDEGDPFADLAAARLGGAVYFLAILFYFRCLRSQRQGAAEH